MLGQIDNNVKASDCARLFAYGSPRVSAFTVAIAVFKYDNILPPQSLNMLCPQDERNFFQHSTVELGTSTVDLDTSTVYLDTSTAKLQVN